MFRVHRVCITRGIIRECGLVVGMIRLSKTTSSSGEWNMNYLILIFTLPTETASGLPHTCSVEKSMRGDMFAPSCECGEAGPLVVPLGWIRAKLRWGPPNILCMTGSIIRTWFVKCIQVIYYFQVSPNILQIVYFVFLAPNATLMLSVCLSKTLDISTTFYSMHMTSTFVL